MKEGVPALTPQLHALSSSFKYGSGHIGPVNEFTLNLDPLH